MAGNQGSPPRKTQQPYQYTKLADVRVGQIINVYGIVKYYKKPFTSMRGELCQTMRIIDQSLDNGEEGLQCVLFANKKGTTVLPNINSIGTIVRFHRLKIGSFNGKLQGVSSPGFAWLVAHDDGKLDHSHVNCTLADTDKQKIKELQNWCQTLPEIRQAKTITLLSEIEPDDAFINIIGQVISIHKSPSDQTCMLVKIWDGTTPKHRSFNFCDQGTAKETLSDKVPAHVARRSFNVHVYDNHLRDVDKLKAGNFVHFCNVRQKAIKDDLFQFSLSRGFIKRRTSEANETWVGLIIHKGTAYGRGIRVLDPTDPAAQTVKARMNDVIEMDNDSDAETSDRDMPEAQVTRQRFNYQSRALQESSTVTRHYHIPFTSIRNILAYPRVPYKFRCRSRVLHYEPTRMDEIVRLGCEKCEICTTLEEMKETVDSHLDGRPLKCGKCCGLLRVEFVMSFLLEDNTGIINAILCGEDAVNFFGGFQSEDAVYCDRTQCQIERRLASLTNGIDYSLDDLQQDIASRPYFECCLKSYSSVCKEDEEERTIVCYRLFDTKLI